MSPEAVATDEFYEALLDDNPHDLYENAPCGYVSTSPDGTIVKVNETFLAWTGFERAELVGRRRLPDLFTAGGRIYYETHIAPMLRMQGRARELAVDLRGATGAVLPVLLNAVLRRDPDGRPTVVRVAVFDATERRAYELELLAQRRRAEASEARARQLAATLQSTLIPPSLPEIPHLRLSAAYRPAGDGAEVGGDFYDVFEAGDGSWVVSIGDVRGKGAEAAVVTSLARHTIRAATYARLEPAEVLRRVNETLRRASPDRFCTVTYLRITPGPGEATVTSVCAGHSPPLIATADACESVPSAGTLLGAFREIELRPVRSTVPAGALLAVYTDGCTEARAADGTFFGDDGIRAALRAAARDGTDDPAADLCERVLAFQDGNPRDDIAIVVATPQPPLPGTMR